MTAVPSSQFTVHLRPQDNVAVVAKPIPANTALDHHTSPRDEEHFMKVALALGRRALLPVLIEHLHEGAEAYRDQEGDDQGGDRAAERRLRNQQPVVGRFRDRLRQSLNGIGLDARVRCMRTRHALHPRGSISRTQFGRAPAPPESM